MSHALQAWGFIEYLSNMVATFLVVLGDAKGTKWVLREQAMAFTRVGGRRAAKLSRGDRLLFYLSGKCLSEFGVRRAPTGRVIGEAVVLTDVRPVRRPVSIAGRKFETECELLFERLAPLGSGLSLKALADRLVLLAGKPNIGQALRISPVALNEDDARLLRRMLKTEATNFDQAKASYLDGSIAQVDPPNGGRWEARHLARQ
jgi:hypothetical protein